MDVLAAVGYSGWVLHVLVWLPVVGMFAVFAAGARAKHVALAVSCVEFLVALPLWWAFSSSTAAFQFASSAEWIPHWGIRYTVGVDGISILLVLLSAFLWPLAILGSYRYITRREPAFYAMMLLLLTGVMGAFVALDLFLFFIFFELMLIPMYFIIGIWGGERRIYAAIKFFLYTAFGSLLMLVAILYLFFKFGALTGGASFAYADLLRVPLTFREQFWLFAAFATAFAIKVPLFPFHTWLPDAHVEAPTPGSVILAAVLLKIGTYGFLRFLLPLFPQAATHPDVVTAMLVLGTVGILYAAWVAAVQPDAKKLIAYTSVAHMGFVVLGIFALTLTGIQGGIIVMLSHGVSTGAMFLLLGMLYERRHTREIAAFGGLAAVAPVFATVFVITALASIGLPGTSGFVGEFLALLGTFETHPWIAVVATLGVIFAAYYMLPMVQRIWFNALDEEANLPFPDLTRREMVVLAPLVAVMLWMGVYPKPFLERTETSVAELLQTVESSRMPLSARAAPAGGAEALRRGVSVPVPPAVVAAAEERTVDPGLGAAAPGEAVDPGGEPAAMEDARTPEGAAVDTGTRAGAPRTGATER